MSLRDIACFVMGHIAYVLPDELWNGREVDCIRCGRVVAYKQNVGFVVVKE